MRSVVGWPDNPAADRLVAWEWIAGTIHHLVVVNLSDSFADGRVWLDAPRAPADGSTVGPSGAGGGAVELIDLLSGARYDRDRGQLAGDGLYVGLPGWGSHLLRFVS
jgi:hypothetical protein